MKGIATFLMTLPLVFAAPTQAAAGESAEPPPDVNILDVAAGELQQTPRVRWTSVAYELSTGHEAELFVEVDDRGRGAADIYVDGEVVVQVTTDGDGGTTTWFAPDIALPPEALAQLAAVNVASEIFAGIDDVPTFECSEFGKGAVKAAKYLWYGLTGALTGACCLGGVGVGCVVCGAAAAAAAEMGGDVADEYCE